MVKKCKASMLNHTYKHIHTSVDRKPQNFHNNFGHTFWGRREPSVENVLYKVDSKMRNNVRWGAEA